jgi:YD repeat-containing protein
VDENVTSWQSGNYVLAGPTYKTIYTYDALSDLTGVSQTDPTSSVPLTRTFQYDTLKRLVQATNPENGTIRSQYDDSGNLQNRWDSRLVPPNSSVTPAHCSDQPTPCVSLQLGFSYDGLNRLQSKAYGDVYAATPTPWVSYSYDAGGSAANANGRLTSVQAGNNSYSRTYDTMGRVQSSTQSTAGTSYPAMSYGYNLAGGLTSFTFPSDRHQTMVYDTAGRASSVASGTTTYLNSPSYFPN